jgi:propionyl-CoA carboxylase alpha chain
MIKASAGGGGKGLRAAYSEAEAFGGFHTACQNEARNRVLGMTASLLKSSDRRPQAHRDSSPCADSHGHSIHPNERECSIQRRHRKVIEEAPSSFITEKTRVAMGEQAVALAKAVQYQSAGTVEFVPGWVGTRVLFLEMNTSKSSTR